MKRCRVACSRVHIAWRHASLYPYIPHPCMYHRQDCCDHTSHRCTSLSENSGSRQLGPTQQPFNTTSCTSHGIHRPRCTYIPPLSSQSHALPHGNHNPSKRIHARFGGFVPCMLFFLAIRETSVSTAWEYLTDSPELSGMSRHEDSIAEYLATQGRQTSISSL